MRTIYGEGRFFGEALGSEAVGVPADRFEYEKYVGDALDDYGEPLHRQMLKLATMAYEVSNKCDDLGYHIYSRMLKEANWRPGMSELTRPIYEALAKVAPLRGENAAVFQKQAAAGVLGWLGMDKLLDGTSSVAPELYATLLSAALAGGSGLGALHWGANRHAVEDEKETEALKAQVDFYDQMTNEINHGLKRKGIVSNGQ